MVAASDSVAQESGAADGVEPTPRYIGRAFFRVSRGFWTGPTRRNGWALTAGVLAFVLASLVTALGVNTWNKFFFDALEKKDVHTVLLGVAAILALASAAVAVGLVHMRMRLQLRWRQRLTRYLIDRWLTDRRFYQLNIVAGEGSNPEFRIADDARLAIEPLVDFV